MACSWAKAGDVDHAIEWLERAADDGFRAASLVDGEPDLETRPGRSPVAALRGPPGLSVMAGRSSSGVAGGSGSGKTTVAERLSGLIGEPVARRSLRLDAYYCDSGAPPARGAGRHQLRPPRRLRLAAAARARRRAGGEGARSTCPVYDFATYERLPERTPVAPARVVVVEGILVLYEPDLRERFDLRVFVDTDADVRFIRRLERDVAERERSLASVIDQYLATVRPSHEQFIEPSKRHADVIIPHGGMNAPALDVLLARVRELL